VGDIFVAMVTGISPTHTFTRRRMHNLGLSGATFDRPEEAVGWLGAVQSQDYGPAKWSVGERVRGSTDAALDQALADGAILRTHVLRPTWHFATPADLRWILELTGTRVHQLNAYHYRQLDLDGPVLAKSEAILAGTLRGGEQRTRKELQAVLDGAGITASGPRLAYIIMSAELNGVVCSGALNGKQHTYALLEERAPDAPSLPRDAALAELTRRYFTSHGPATAKDFQWWSSLTLADIRDGLELAAPHLEREEVDGVTFWSAPGAPVPALPRVHLLHRYDEYVVGYSESKYLLNTAGNHADGATGPNSIVFLDTQVAGHWRRTVTKDSVLIEVDLYAPFDAAQTAALHAAVDRQGAFLGRPATVVVTA
jgi:hypothetical protein